MKKKLAIILALVLAVSLLAPAAALATEADTYKVTFELTGPNAGAIQTTATLNYNYVAGSKTLSALFTDYGANALVKQDSNDVYAKFKGTGLFTQLESFINDAKGTDSAWETALSGKVGTELFDILKDRNKQVYEIEGLSPITIKYPSTASATYTLKVFITVDTYIPDEPSTTTTEEGDVIEGDTANAEEVKDEEGNTTGYIIEVLDGVTEATVPVKTDVEDDLIYDIDIPDGTTCLVTIPLEEAGPNTVVKLIHADGTEEILPITAFTDDSIKLILNDDVKIKIEEAEGAPEDRVDPEAWYKPAMDFMYSHEIIDEDIPEEKADPTEECDRETFVTFLYNMFREPDAPETSGFYDVELGEYFSDAIAWAREVGIIEGTSETTFEGDQPITREQIVTILWRMAGQPEAADVDTGSHDWAADAMSWAVSIGLIKGNGDGTGYRPEDVATVAEASQLLMNFVNMLYAGVSN